MDSRHPTRKPLADPPGRTLEKLPMADEQDLLQIRERLEWTPEERLSYLRDMIAFEELAHSARRI